MRKLLLGALAGVAAAALVAPVAASASSKGEQRLARSSSNAPASVTLVHGIPGANGFPVDISIVNKQSTGAIVASSVTFTKTATVALPKGAYRVNIRAAGADPFSAPVLSRELEVKAGSNVSVVAYLSEAGQPRLGAFRNDVSNPGTGNARVIVRHLAAAPAVDVYANGAKLISALRNPRSAAAVVPANTYTVKVTAAGNASVVALPDTPLKLDAGKTTIVYAVGQFPGTTFTPVVQTIG